MNVSEDVNVRKNKNMIAALKAGLFSGLMGLMVFLIIHHFWIMPIWFIMPIGIVIAGLGGLAIGWAYFELLPHFPARPWTVFALTGLVGIILLPSILLAEIRAPMFEISASGSRLNISVSQATLLFILELPLTAAITGGLAGWIIGRTKRAMFATALAGVIFALGPGHNIPFLGNTPGTVKGILILLAIVLLSAFVLVEGFAILSRR